MFFTMAAEKFPEIWEKVPSYNDVSPHMLSFEIMDRYCTRYWYACDTLPVINLSTTCEIPNCGYKNNKTNNTIKQIGKK